MGLIFVIDSLLFPMFHIGELPIKPSYLILVFWMIFVFFYSKKVDKDFLKIVAGFALIIICALVGETIMEFTFPDMRHAETGWSIMIYLLAILSYGFSKDLLDFNFNWLWPLLLSALGVNFFLIFLSNAFPF